MGVLDPAMHDAEAVEAVGPCLQLIAVAAGERDMIKAGTGARRICSTRGLGVK